MPSAWIVLTDVRHQWNADCATLIWPRYRPTESISTPYDARRSRQTRGIPTRMAGHCFASQQTATIGAPGVCIERDGCGSTNRRSQPSAARQYTIRPPQRARPASHNTIVLDSIVYPGRKSAACSAWPLRADACTVDTLRMRAANKARSRDGAATRMPSALRRAARRRQSSPLST